MITAKFARLGERLCSFEISGHAEYAEYGSDIVCAAVTSAVELVVNAICEILSVKAEVLAENNVVSLKLPDNCSETAYCFMSALLLHLNVIAEDYQGTVNVIVLEV